MSLTMHYVAAQYYLSEEKPMCISEAQRSQLAALHLSARYGPYTENKKVPELNSCTAMERKRKEEEWAQLGTITKRTAMVLFVDLVYSLFPNWIYYKKIHTDFLENWQTAKYAKRKVKEISFRLSQRPERKFKNLSFDHLDRFQTSRMLKKRSNLPKIDALTDASLIVHKQKMLKQCSPVRKQHEESVYYRDPVRIKTRNFKGTKNRVRLLERLIDKESLGKFL